jgi:prepilin-type N-terminal cleavage/methylation domain-containing protein
MMNRGFTVIELVVSIGIFAVMTSLVVVKYGTFNQSTLLTDTAYDIALALHTAQNYGLSVKNTGASSNPFSFPYAISFSPGVTGHSCGASMANNKHIVLYADADPIGTPDGVCKATDSAVTTYAITRGATIAPTTSGSGSGICVGAGVCSFYNITQLDVSFTRPNPEAKICANGSATSCYSYAEVTIVGTDGSTRTIVIRENGQVSVKP